MTATLTLAKGDKVTFHKPEPYIRGLHLELKAIKENHTDPFMIIFYDHLLDTGFWSCFTHGKRLRNSRKERDDMDELKRKIKKEEARLKMFRM